MINKNIMKYCGTCKQEKELIEFNKNKSKKDGLNSICRECSKKRSKKYYSENIKKHKKVVLERRNDLKSKNRLKYFQLLLESKCVDCENTNPLVLDFDHRNHLEKEYAVCKMITEGYSWGKIEKEIGKCDIRCANCHRIRTAKQFKWEKYVFFEKRKNHNNTSSKTT